MAPTSIGGQCLVKNVTFPQVYSKKTKIYSHILGGCKSCFYVLNFSHLCLFFALVLCFFFYFFASASLHQSLSNPAGDVVFQLQPITTDTPPRKSISSRFSVVCESIHYKMACFLLSAKDMNASPGPEGGL